MILQNVFGVLLSHVMLVCTMPVYTFYRMPFLGIYIAPWRFVSDWGYKAKCDLFVFKSSATIVSLRSQNIIDALVTIITCFMFVLKVTKM